MIATMDPRQADAVIVGEGDAPLWEYFSRLLADEAIAAPKGRGSRTASTFPLQAAISWAPLEGTIIALLDPQPAPAG
jgi:hypothetical protein